MSLSSDEVQNVPFSIGISIPSSSINDQVTGVDIFALLQVNDAVAGILTFPSNVKVLVDAHKAKPEALAPGAPSAPSFTLTIEI